MGIYTRILESLNLSEEKPLTPRQKAQKAGLVSKGGGAWAKEKGGKTVARTDGDKLVAVSGDEEEPTDTPPEEKPKKKKPEKKQTSKNVAGGTPAIVPFTGTEPESVKGINKLQSDLEKKRASGVAGAGGQSASQGEAVYCNVLNSLDNDKFKEENSDAIEAKKKEIASSKILTSDKEDLKALGLDSESPEGIDYLATREVFADTELAKIKKSPPNKPPKSNNVFFMKKGFGGKDKDYKSWMKAAYDGGLATRKILKEDTNMDTSKPMTTLQSTGDIDNKIAGDLETKLKASKSDEDKAYYKQELADFQHFRKYHDTYTVGVDKEGRTHIVSISNKKGSDLKDPQNNTTPAKRFNVIKDRYGEDVAKTVTKSLDENIKKVRETKINAARGGADVPIDDELIDAISDLDDKYMDDIDKPKSDYAKWLKKNGITAPSGMFPKNAKEKLELRNRYVKERQGQYDEANERLYEAIEKGAKPTDKPPAMYTDSGGKEKPVFQKRDKKEREADPDGPEYEDTPAIEAVTYNSFGRLYTKLGEKNENATKGGLAECVKLKTDEKEAVSQAHRQVIEDVYKADGGKPKPGDDNGPHAQGYVDTVMDAMHFNSYIDGGDGKMIIQMGIRGAQPSQIRGCLAEQSGYTGDTEDKEALKEHLRKRCKIDEKKGNILIQDDKGERVLAEDTFRTAGTGQKVASGFGKDMRGCVSSKVDEKRASKETSENYQYESLASAYRRVKHADF